MDLEAIISAALVELRGKMRYRLPIMVATIAANGAVLFTRITEAPAGSAAGSVAIEHVTGEVGDDGFEAPMHLMFTDATGRARLAVARGSGPPTFLSVVEEDG